MIVGFTGTRKGMSPFQKEELYDILYTYSIDNYIIEFDHGDCIGADIEAAEIAYELDYWIIAHPGYNSNKEFPTRGYFKYNHVILEAKPYIVRDKDIVNRCDVLIAAPVDKSKRLIRSGTWTTYRYAESINKERKLL